MPGRNKLRSSFAYGELSPRMLGRADLRGVYNQGLRECVNWLQDKTGSIRYRAGTQHSYPLGANRAYRLVPFDVNGQPAILALNTAGARVYYAPRASGRSRTYTPSYRVTDENQRSDTSMFDWQVNGVAGASMDPAGFDLLTAQSNQVAVGNLSEEVLARIQWRQQPFFQIETRTLMVSSGRNAGADLDPLHADNLFPAGLWSNGSTMWISDRAQQAVFAYDLASGAVIDAEGFTLEQSGGYGIWSNGVTMWVSDILTERLVAYEMSSKNLIGGRDIPLVAANTSPIAIWGNSTTIFVADSLASKVFAYNIAGKYHDGTKDVELPSAPQGIWGEGDFLWVALENNRLEAYNWNTKQHATDRDLTLDAANNQVADIWRTGNTWWVIDFAADKLYAYTYTETETVTVEDPLFKVYLFHPEIDPVLLTWDAVANTLSAATGTDDVLNDPPLVGNRVAAGTFFEQRLAVGGGEKFPQSIVGSRTPSPETGRPRFSDWEQIDNTLDVPTVFASHAFSYTMFSDIAIRIRWLANYAETVFIGCDHAIYIARELSPDTPPIIRLHSIIGAASVQPVVAPFGIIYASVDRTRVYEAFSKRDLTAHAEHLFETDPIKELAWTQNPVQRLWALTESGAVRVLTISQENGVFAWSQIEFAQSVSVKSIAVGNGTDAGDTLWLAAERDGTVSLEALREPNDLDQADRCYLDSSVAVVASAAGGVSGLGHLAGVANAVAAAVASARDERQQLQDLSAVSAGGTADTDFDNQTVRVGIPYTAALELPTLAQLPGGEGSAFGQPQRISKVTVGRYRSFGGRVGQHRTRMRELPPNDPETMLKGTESSDLGETVSIPDFTSDFESSIRVEQTVAQPFNLLYVEIELSA